MSATEAKEIVDQVLEEQAIALNGLAVGRELSDRQVHRLVESLEAIRGRMMVQLANSDCVILDNIDSTHPAVEQFLAKLRVA